VSGITGKVEILFNSDQDYTIRFLGSEQRPIIITSVSEIPSGGDWSAFIVNQNNNYLEDYMLTEYGINNKQIGVTNADIKHNIIRYNLASNENSGLFVRYGGQNVFDNEIHNCQDAINCFPEDSPNLSIKSNFCFLNYWKGIFTGNTIDQQATQLFFDNIFVKSFCGIGSEVYSSDNNRFFLIFVH
jgi:hypothetical protein